MSPRDGARKNFTSRMSSSGVSGAVVSREMINVQLTPAVFQAFYETLRFYETFYIPPSRHCITRHCVTGHCVNRRCVKISSPFREVGSMEATAKHISLGLENHRKGLQNIVCVPPSTFQWRGIYLESVDQAHLLIQELQTLLVKGAIENVPLPDKQVIIAVIV